MLSLCFFCRCISYSAGGRPDLFAPSSLLPSLLPPSVATNGVVIATEKKLPSVLIDEAHVQKVELINPSTGFVFSGLGPDYRVLVRKSRKVGREGEEGGREDMSVLVNVCVSIWGCLFLCFLPFVEQDGHTRSCSWSAGGADPGARAAAMLVVFDSNVRPEAEGETMERSVGREGGEGGREDMSVLVNVCVSDWGCLFLCLLPSVRKFSDRVVAAGAPVVMTLGLK
jgi:hypothetical protein